MIKPGIMIRYVKLAWGIASLVYFVALRGCFCPSEMEENEYPSGLLTLWYEENLH